MNRSLKNITAILFDMDGVLFLSSGAHAKAFEETFASVGITDLSYDTIAGMRTDEAIKKIFEQNNKILNNTLLKELTAKKQQRVQEILKESGEVSPKSDEILSTLANNYKLALASSASQGTIDIYHQKSKSFAVFSACLSGKDVTQAKPEPDIYLVAAEKLGVQPDQCVVVEDASNGVIAGKRAGMIVIGITGTEEKSRLLAAGADYVITKLDELIPLLKGNI